MPNELIPVVFDGDYNTGTSKPHPNNYPKGLRVIDFNHDWMTTEADGAQALPGNLQTWLETHGDVGETYGGFRLSGSSELLKFLIHFTSYSRWSAEFELRGEETVLIEPGSMRISDKANRILKRFRLYVDGDGRRVWRLESEWVYRSYHTVQSDLCPAMNKEAYERMVHYVGRITGLRHPTRQHEHAAEFRELAAHPKHVLFPDQSLLSSAETRRLYEIIVLYWYLMGDAPSVLDPTTALAQLLDAALFVILRKHVEHLKRGETYDVPVQHLLHCDGAFWQTSEGRKLIAAIHPDFPKSQLQSVDMALMRAAGLTDLEIPRSWEPGHVEIPISQRMREVRGDIAAAQLKQERERVERENNQKP